MNADRVDPVIHAAIAHGILPPGTVRSAEEQRPWPVVLLTALGAWLAAAPLLMAAGTAFNGLLTRGIGPYLVGGLMLAAMTMLLRTKKLPLFLEQLAVPGLLVGGAMLGTKLYRDLGDQGAALLMAALSLCIAALVGRSWLRALLGGAACAFVMFALLPNTHADEAFRLWLAIHATLAAWVLAVWLSRVRTLDGRRALMLEWLSLGWILVTLSALALWTGMTFLADASLRVVGGGSAAGLMTQPWRALAQLCSTALALCAAVWIVHCWPSLRRPWSGLSALVLIALAWLMPSLGATLLILATFCAARHWRVAMAAGSAAAWIIGAFYYQLDFPLATKAWMLVGAGALLAAIAWSAMRIHGAPDNSDATPASPLPARIGIALCALAVLTVINGAIWQKETLIAKGRPVFVELAPVDPRSLMQGDYMRLAFRLPQSLRGNRQALPGASRLHAVGKIDARGILTLDRLTAAAPPAADEMTIELTPQGNGWTLVTDAWYFKEGEAARWARAKYGEFRVDASGRALLVGLRGPELEPL